MGGASDQNIGAFVVVDAEGKGGLAVSRSLGDLSLRAAGVNRLSLGIQSLDDGDLAFLGRKHSAEEAIDALNSLMAAGLFFLLGPFVVNAVQRWWDVRRDCVGALWGVVDDLSTYSASWCRPHDRTPNPQPLTCDPSLPHPLPLDL